MAKVTLNLTPAQLRLLIEALDYFESDMDSGGDLLAAGWTNQQWKAFRLASIQVRAAQAKGDK